MRSMCWCHVDSLSPCRWFNGNFLTHCSHPRGLRDWRMEFLEVDDLGLKRNQNKLGPLEDLLEVATPMGAVG